MEKPPKQNFVDIEKWCNFVVNDFFILNHLSVENYIRSSQIWNSNFAYDLGWRHDQNKFIDIKKLCNFVFDNFLFEIIYLQKTMFEVLTFKFWIFKWPQMEEWQKTKAVYLKELYNFVIWQPFHLKSFSRKTVFEFLTFKIIFFKRSRWRKY